MSRSLWIFLFLMILWSGSAGLLILSSGPQTLRSAEGSSVVLGCRYRSSPSDTGDLDIEWTNVSPDPTSKDQMLISFSGGNTFVHSEVRGLSFSSDPAEGDASLSIRDLSRSHTATYQCKVKKSPGVDSRKVTLQVLVKPSPPRCWVEGGGRVGEAAALICHSDVGSAPLKYTWSREGGASLPVTASQNSANGELRISNVSLSSSGFYRCDVVNAVGSERCAIHLKTLKPPNGTAVTIGTSAGSLLLVFVLLVLVALLYWRLGSRWRRRKEEEEEFSNDIREDAPPPQSRPGSSSTRYQRGAYAPPSSSSWSSSGNETPLKTSQEGGAVV